METKTVRAETMLEALEVIKRELGNDAIVVSVRQVLAAPAWQVWQKPMVEVLAMKGPISGKSKSSPSQIPLSQSPIIYDRKGVIHSHKPENEEKLSRFVVGETGTQPPDTDVNVSRTKNTNTTIQESKGSSIRQDRSEKLEFPPAIKRYSDLLLKQGVDESLVQRISKNCVENLPDYAFENDQRVKEYFKVQLSGSLRFNKQKDRTPRIICLVGSSGSGKTSICAKLIIHLSNGLEKKVTWVCADTNKISAIAEARVYAETIGVPLKLAYTPEELSSIVKVSELESNYVVIDTPAINPFSDEKLIEIRTLLQSLPQMTIWFVAAASNSSANLLCNFSVISPFHPKGLVITKVDETSRLGDVYTFAWRSHLPVIFFSTGSRILDDLRSAEPDYLVNALFEERLV